MPAENSMIFQQTKVAQAAAWFLAQSSGEMTILKLMKLLYLADRQALQDLDRTITGDRMVSMPHGPVLSQTLELANGQITSVPGGWDSWIQDRADRNIALRQGVEANRSALNCLSDAEFEMLEKVQQKFGSWSAIQLRDYTHRSCAEWRDPNGSSVSIKSTAVLMAVGKTAEQARAISERIKRDREVSAIFASL